MAINARRVTHATILCCLGSATAGFAQESGIIDAINLGSITGSSLLALPVAPDTNAAPLPPGLASATDDVLFQVKKEQEEDITDRAFPLLAAKWPFNKVFVCWEEASPEFVEERAGVREAIRDTWEASSGLQFLGWNSCQDNSVGIRIQVFDGGPHVKFLGKYLNGVKNGMVLNFTYSEWGDAYCAQHKDFCNRAIAVHEFGHAIGFAHEQNRPDTPGECAEPPQGGSGDALLTPWDPHSVMNYCNEKYINDGVLSNFDIVAVQYIYGID